MLEEADKVALVTARLLDIKLCRNCRLCDKEGAKTYEYAKCLHPTSIITPLRKYVDLVSGEAKETPITYHHCSVIREQENSKYCGKQGQFYEEKS